MPSLLDSLESLFETRDLYEVLGTKKEASEAQIRKAYHKVKITDSILLMLICYLLDLVE
jgi:preprotein translocase subunit Sec63